MIYFQTILLIFEYLISYFEIRLSLSLSLSLRDTLVYTCMYMQSKLDYIIFGQTSQ